MKLRIENDTAGGAPTEDRLTLAGLIEGDAEPLLFTPHDAAMPLNLVAGHRKCEVIGDVNRSRYFDPCAGLGEVLDKTIDLTVTAPNRSGLQQSTARYCSTFHGINRSTKIYNFRN